MAVWTGSEMIVWGGLTGDGFPNNGGRYNPTTNTWRPLSTTSAPSGRWRHTAVWTGSEMIVWGGEAFTGRIGDGGRYNPATDTWTPVPTAGLPGPRQGTGAVWSGSEMIVWGGSADTGRYNPTTNTWTALRPPGIPTACQIQVGAVVWTGLEMLEWGGTSSGMLYDSAKLYDGVRYIPATDVWAPLSSIGAPSPRSGHTAIWTGSEMIVWGGGGTLNDGARYTPGPPPAATVSPPESFSLQVTLVDPTHIRLDWNDIFNNETGFKIFEANAFPSASDGPLVATVGPNVTSYTVNGVSGGTYRVYAFNNSGVYASSNIAGNSSFRGSEVWINVTQSGFIPQTVAVRAGTRLLWVNNSGSQITVTSEPHGLNNFCPVINLGALGPGLDALQLVLDEPGLYPYHNYLNPDQRAAIIVFGSAPPPTGADLSVSKSASPDQVTVGQNLTYTAVVTNNGPSTATGVTLTDVLDSRLTFVSAGSTLETCTPAAPPLPTDRTVRCTIGNLTTGAPGNSATVTIVVKPTAAGPIANTATAAGNETDSNTTNNTATATTTAIARQIVFVHGINGNFRSIQRSAQQGASPGQPWQDLIRALTSKYGGANVAIFAYYQDKGYGLPNQPNSCDPQAGMPAPDKATSPLYTPPNSIDSTICDSKGALAYSSTELDRSLASLSTPTAIISHSMGAAITRGWLTLAQARSNLQKVDTVIFLQAAHQGSYLATLGEGLNATLNNPLSDVFTYGLAGTVGGLLTDIAASYDFDPNRFGIIDVTGGSTWYRSVNPPNVPTQLHYFNFYTDIQVSTHANFHFFTLPLTSTTSLGDLVMLPGTPNPTDIRRFGGARFLPFNSTAADRYEFALNRSYDFSVSYVVKALVDDAVKLQLRGALGSDPANHSNLSSNLTNTTIAVPSCRANQPAMTPLQQILVILDSPANVCG